MQQETMSKSQVWQIYSKVPVPEDLLNKEGDVHYVNWMDTYQKAMNPAENVFMDVSWEIITDDNGSDVWFFPAGNGNVTAEVKIAMNVNGVVHQASLPVWDSKHTSIINPTSSDINNTKMRVRCKAFGELGLFYQLWSKEYNSEKSKTKSNVVSINAANDETQTPQVDIGVQIQEFYNNKYSEHLVLAETPRDFKKILERVHNLAKNTFGEDTINAEKREEMGKKQLARRKAEAKLAKESK
tara:strand:- start:7 stop:729 length:723 start_codon:yes stop_codon:yes gene_type:complete